MTGTGLRERKKQRTREALRLAALDLFGSQGYEATTVDAIAEAAGVSPRTYFRYFDTKFDPLLSVLHEASAAMLAALAARPAGEGPFTALLAAGELALRASADRWPEQEDGLVYLRAVVLTDATPVLAAAHAQLLRDHEQALAEELARRTGVDPETDPRPRLLAAVYTSAVLQAHRAWHAAATMATASGRPEGTTGLSGLLDTVERYARLVGPAVTEPWHPDDPCVREGVRTEVPEARRG